MRGYHWVLIALGLASVASAAVNGSASAGGAAPPSGGGSPGSKPLRRSLLDATGLRKRIEAEPDLVDTILAWANKKGWGEEHLDYFVAIVGNLESGWNPQAVNPYTKATGIIQFMPQTARGLWTTVEDLYRMTATEQMKYVEAFFSPYKKLAPRDIYPAIFYPATIGKSDDTVIFRSGQKGYQQNAGLDENKDGTITAGDVRRKADSAVASLRQKPRLEV